MMKKFSIFQKLIYRGDTRVSVECKNSNGKILIANIYRYRYNLQTKRVMDNI